MAVGVEIVVESARVAVVVEAIVGGLGVVRVDSPVAVVTVAVDRGAGCGLVIAQAQDLVSDAVTVCVCVGEPGADAPGVADVVLVATGGEDEQGEQGEGDGGVIVFNSISSRIGSFVRQNIQIIKTIFYLTKKGAVQKTPKLI